MGREFVLISLVWMSCSSPGALSQAITFSAPVRLPAPAPDCVAIADVNGDGHRDVLSCGDDRLSIFLGNGKGAFSPATGSPFAAGPSPNDIAVTDFNNDGKIDVAIADHGVKKLTVMLGNGAGQFVFAPGSPFDVESTPHPHGIIAADFGGDGKADIAVESWSENKVLVLRGNGDGTFRTPGTKFEVGKMPYQRLRCADLNRDGKPDIVTSNFEGSSVTVLWGDGRGGFSRTGDITVPPCPFSLALGDFNGDGIPDIAVGHYSGHASDPGKNGVSILMGNGKGGFVLDKKSPYPVGNYPSTLVAADLNGDGCSDCIVPQPIDQTVTIYLGGKDGLRQAEGSPLRGAQSAQFVAAGDLNGDGKGDLVIGCLEEKELLVFLQK